MKDIYETYTPVRFLFGSFQKNYSLKHLDTASYNNFKKTKA